MVRICDILLNGYKFFAAAPVKRCHISSPLKSGLIWRIALANRMQQKGSGKASLSWPQEASSFCCHPASCCLHANSLNWTAREARHPN